MENCAAADNIRRVLQRPGAAIMGIVNVTPDSFSDGGRFVDPDGALRHALFLIDDGADILDVGGESTRPGADTVSLQQELDRVLPVIERIKTETDHPMSIDTCKPQVMAAAVEAGVTMINDVNGLQREGAIEVVAQSAVPACIMHMAGQPETMQNKPEYSDVVAEVIKFLNSRIDACIERGVLKSDLVVDPGIGFGKTLEHNLRLLKALPEIRQQLACDVLVGVSRKSMIDGLLSRPVDQRLPASLGLAVQAVLNGARIVRVHDVRATCDAVRSVEAVLNV